jgi:hypothetical protein
VVAHLAGCAEHETYEEYMEAIMAHLAGTRFGTHARVLVAAVALGTAVLSLSPGQTVYAARGIATEAGDADSGGTDSGGGTATRININNKPKCTITRPDGHVDFYLPGTTYVRDGKHLICGNDGQWVVVGRTGALDGPISGGSGVYTPAP